MTDALKDSFEILARRARADGAELELMASGGESLSLGYQGGQLEKYQSSATRSAGVRVILGEAQGYASTENLSAESLERTYQAALENARTVRVANDGELPMAVASTLSDEMKDLYRSEEIDVQKKMEIAKNLEAKALAKDPRIVKIPYSGFSDSKGWVRILNTKGIDRFHQSSGYSGYSYVMAEEGEAKKMDGESFFHREFAQIQLDKVVDAAVQRALALLPARRMKTGTLPVIFDREISSTILAMLGSSLSAREVHEKTSLLIGKLGQKIASAEFELIDDPFDRKMTGCRPFDSEGCASQKTTLIEKGVLKSFLTNLEMAKKLSLPHTAHAARSPGSRMDISSTNLIVKPGTMTQEQMRRQAPRMLLVTKFNGGLHAGFKAASGDFSLPAEGFLIENGEVVSAVDQFVVSGNILDLLTKISGVGNEYSPTPSSDHVPDILISELSIAGEA